MRYLLLHEVVLLHRWLIEATGGAAGLRDFGLLVSAVAQPAMAFGGADLYPTIEEKAAALLFSLVQNHPFVDGNKRVGHAAMETFLVLNGYELDAPLADAEATILGLASGRLTREELRNWITEHLAQVAS